MISGIIIYGLTAIAGAIVGIFFYRNNQKKVSKIADKVDDVWDDRIKKD